MSEFFFGELVIELRKKPFFKETSEHIILANNLCFFEFDSQNIFETQPVDLLRLYGTDFWFLKFCKITNQVIIIIGPSSSNFIYYQIDNNTLTIRDYLPRIEFDRSTNDYYDIEGANSLLASVLLSGAFDLKFQDKTIHKKWKRFVPCARHSLNANGNIICQLFQLNENLFSGNSLYNEAIENAREALFNSLRKFTKKNETVAVEVSGGIDSGIIFSALKKNNKIKVIPVFYDYQYYEFARERAYREMLLEYVGAEEYNSERLCKIPYDDFHLVPYHDEPSVNSPSWRQFLQLTTLSLNHGSKILFSGHGGDRLFLDNPFEPDKLLSSAVFNLKSKYSVFMDPSRIDAIESLVVQGYKYLKTTSYSNVNAEWSPVLFDPVWPSRFANIGLDVYRSGLTQHMFVKCLQELWGFSGRFSQDNKAIARLVFDDLLPRETWLRSGKVNHVGLVARGLIKNKDFLHSLILNGSALIEFMGFDKKKVYSGFNALFQGKLHDSNVMSYIFSFLLWEFASKNNIGNFQSNEFELKFHISMIS